MAKTWNPSIHDPRFEEFPIPYLDHFVDGHRGELLLHSIRGQDVPVMYGLDLSTAMLMDLLPMRIAGWLEVRAHEIRKIATSLLFMMSCTV